jgi:hypothetical protein
MGWVHDEVRTGMSVILSVTRTAATSRSTCGSTAGARFVIFARSRRRCGNSGAGTSPRRAVGVAVRIAAGRRTRCACAARVSRDQVSRIERGELDRAEIAAMHGYVEALGGEVEIVAKFGEERITVR